MKRFVNYFNILVLFIGCINFIKAEELPPEGFVFDTTDRIQATLKYIYETKGPEFYKQIWGKWWTGNIACIEYKDKNAIKNTLKFWVLSNNGEYEVYKVPPNNIDHDIVFEFQAEFFLRFIFGDGYNSLTTSSGFREEWEWPDGSKNEYTVFFTIDHQPFSIFDMIKNWKVDGPQLYIAKLIFIKEKSEWNIKDAKIEVKYQDTDKHENDYKEERSFTLLEIQEIMSHKDNFEKFKLKYP